MRARMRISGGTELTVRAARMWPAFVFCSSYGEQRTNAGGMASSWSRPSGEQRVPDEQLYDFSFDPNELNNLSADPAHQRALAELRERLLEWMRATGDPLLDGPVLEPPGAWSNDPRQASPNDPTSAAER